MKLMKIVKCVGCGFCCLKAPCAVAIHIHGEGVDRCPELVWVKDKYRCRVANDPRYRAFIGPGKGCCRSLNSWREDVRQRERAEANPARRFTITVDFDNGEQPATAERLRERMEGLNIWSGARQTSVKVVEDLDGQEKHDRQRCSPKVHPVMAFPQP